MSRNRFVVALVAFLGMIASIVVYEVASYREHAFFIDTYNELVDTQVEALRRELGSDFEFLFNLRSFYYASEYVERGEFATYLATAMQRHSDFRAVEWIPRVSHEQRAEFVSSTRAEGYPNFEITELDDSGQLVTAGKRDEYYPIFYALPQNENLAALGFDVASEGSRRQALEKARILDSVVATAPVQIVQEQGKMYYALFILPVYARASELPADLRVVDGYVVTIVGINELLSKYLYSTPNSIFGSLSTRIEDVAEATSTILFENGGESALIEYQRISPISVAERQWVITSAPTHTFYSHFHTFQPAIFLLGGAMLTMLVCLYLIRQFNERASIAQLVEQRTNELQYSEAKALAIMEGAGNAIVVIDSEGRILKYNRAAIEMFGYGVDEVVGKNVNMLMPEPYHSNHDRFLKSYLATGKNKIIGGGREVSGRRKDGTEIPVYLSVAEVKLNSEYMFVGVLIDLSEQQKIDRFKSEFVSTVSHELRTPLTAINGALRLIMGGAVGEVPDKMKELLEMAQRNTDRQLLMVNDLLDFQKLESGRMPFSYEVLDISELVEASVELSLGYADEFSVRLKMESLLPGIKVKVDPNRLTQVLANLISNAIKFSPPNAEVVVKQSILVNRVRITVVDHGQGIPDAFRSRIFGRFAQADASNTRQTNGTGLGLAISKMIIEQMNGTIGFESEEGAGARFYFELPIEEMSVS